MLSYIIRRLIYMVILLWVISIVGFIVIELPPGSFVESRIHALQQFGYGNISNEEIAIALTKEYGLDLPAYLRYSKWVWKFLHGNFGISLAQGRPIVDLIVERLPITIVLSMFSFAFAYIVAIPIGIYSATHQYSSGDYFFTVVGFAGLAIPNFILALILMFFFYEFFGVSLTGLFSPEYVAADWSVAKLMNALQHFPLPIIVIGTAGTAWLIRVMRGCLLDELQKQYVITARAKGVAERTLLFKYPVRVAINPVISTVGWMLPTIFSGEVITAIVLSLPTTGNLFYRALMEEDIYLAASILMIISALTLFGTLISDLLLVWIDPRIRYERGI